MKSVGESFRTLAQLRFRPRLEMQDVPSVEDIYVKLLCGVLNGRNLLITDDQAGIVI